MGKGATNSGLPVFGEVVKMIDKQKENKLALEHKANRHPPCKGAEQAVIYNYCCPIKLQIYNSPSVTCCK